jgi:polyisoprenoid-binding protein YceI
MAAALVTLDAGTVTVAFSVRWFGLVAVRGSFGVISGAMKRTTTDTIDLALDVASDSVRTGISLRDAHLRGPRFLDAPRYPRMLFRGRATRGRDGAHHVEGTLTLRGVGRMLSLECREGSEVAGAVPARATFAVSRADHDIGTAAGLARVNPLLWAIGAEVQVTITVLVPTAMFRQESLLARVR